MLVFTLKPTKAGTNKYEAGQFIDMSDTDGKAFVAANNGVDGSTMDPIAVTALMKPKAAPVALPASAKMDFVFSAPSKIAAGATAAALTASVTKAPAAAGQTGVITVNGGPANSAGTIVVVMAIDGAADVTYTANIPKGTTAAQAGGLVEASFTPKTGFTSATSGPGAVTITPNPATKNITKFTVTVTGTA